MTANVDREIMGDLSELRLVQSDAARPSGTQDSVTSTSSTAALAFLGSVPVVRTNRNSNIAN